jgi:pimeloyl-ACP methyl ester carboxylesterase
MADATEPTTRVIEGGDVRIHTMSLGPESGPMVLLLHGFPARWSTWRVPMRALADAGYFVVAPDLRGYGASDKPKGATAYSVERLVGDAVAVVRGFGRERACIAGHDFGGGLAWATAMFHPEIVTRLCTINSVHPVGFERQMRKWSQIKKSWYVFFFLLPRLPEWWLSRKDFRFVKRSLADDGLDATTIDDLVEGIRPEGAMRASIDWYRASFRDGAKKLVKPVKVEMPMLSIWGDRERHLDPELAQPPADWVTDVRVEHIADAGHWAQHDAPETVSKLMVDHFSRG